MDSGTQLGKDAHSKAWRRRRCFAGRSSTVNHRAHSMPGRQNSREGILDGAVQWELRESPSGLREQLTSFGVHRTAGGWPFQRLLCPSLTACGGEAACRLP